jgi:hypothetical protein
VAVWFRAERELTGVAILQLDKHLFIGGAEAVENQRCDENLKVTTVPLFTVFAHDRGDLALDIDTERER